MKRIQGWRFGPGKVGKTAAFAALALALAREADARWLEVEGPDLAGLMELEGLVLADPAPVESGPAVPLAGLAVAIRKNLSGFSPEERPADRKFADAAREFVAYRTGRMSGQRKLDWVASCFRDQAGRQAGIVNPEEKPGVFCNFMVEPWRQKKEDDEAAAMAAAAAPETPEPVVEARLDVFKVSEALGRADLKTLGEAREGLVYRALKLFPSWEPLQAVADEVLDGRACRVATVATALGQKAEEFFPAPRFRKVATELYAKAAECGLSSKEAGSKEGDSVAKASYRLALLRIWEGDCRKAEPLLIGLSERRDSDFQSRSIYWRAHCAQASGNKLLAAVMKGRLLKEFPLSYHGLLLAGGKARDFAHAARMLDLREPAVAFRSAERPELNEVVRGVEALQRLRANDLALELLGWLEPRIAGTESAFRLYVALLMSRSGSMISQFRTLSGVFRDDPTTITRSSMEMYYPLKRFDVIRRYVAKIDPFLVAALIRQESGFNERARSHAGALGLMQLMPETARRMERVSRRELFDAKTNVRLGVKYFFQLLDRFEGDAELALAGYNAGPDKVDDWRRRYPVRDRMLFADLIPFKETREYVAYIARNYYWYLGLYGAGADRRPGRFAATRPIILTLFAPGGGAPAH